MKKNFGLVCLLAIALVGCVKKSDTSVLLTTSSKADISIKISYEYDDLEEKIIYWDEIPLVDLNEFYVYFFSRTCVHCQKIKQQVIPLILKHNNCFACESSNEFEFCALQPTGNLKEIDFCIIGYPTAVYFKRGCVITYANGENEVLALLS